MSELHAYDTVRITRNLGNKLKNDLQPLISEIMIIAALNLCFISWLGFF